MTGLEDLFLDMYLGSNLLTLLDPQSLYSLQTVSKHMYRAVNPYIRECINSCREMTGLISRDIYQEIKPFVIQWNKYIFERHVYESTLKIYQSWDFLKGPVIILDAIDCENNAIHYYEQRKPIGLSNVASVNIQLDSGRWVVLCVILHEVLVSE